MIDDIPLDKIVEPHHKEIFLDTTDENGGSPSNDCPNVRPGKSLSSSPVHHEPMVTGTKENEVTIENNEKSEIKEESDDITNSLFGKCGKCQKPRPGMFACPGSMDNTYDRSKQPEDSLFLEKLFGCLHVYCLECMGKLIQSSAEPEKVLCPICHCLTPLDLVAENKFGTNFTPVR